MTVFLKKNPKTIHVVDTTLVCILLGQHSSFPVQILMNLLLLVIHLITGNEWIVINLLLLKEENKIFPFPHFFPWLPNVSMAIDGWWLSSLVNQSTKISQEEMFCNAAGLPME